MADPIVEKHLVAAKRGESQGGHGENKSGLPESCRSNYEGNQILTRHL